MVLSLVDDDEIFQFIISRCIANIDSSIRVKLFKDGEEGINYLRTNLGLLDELPDIILLDINMPFMDGWQFLKEFQYLKPSLEKKIFIYLLTSSKNPEDLNRAKQIGELTGYLVKPITRAELQTLIEKFPLESWYKESCAS
ncbi:response regulator [Aquimarina muelleri]|uniref:Response regulator n=1 Tax=Aquimarina muelleri TaxID=279356 RepID=A0A918JVK3_9FLAO|nr:response regulator [Aquimarina muelleri]MCX2764432.1 response regulator [Aquimarina muelleri]GGX21304.1 response regulator [Aquimarina muelleri]